VAFILAQAPPNSVLVPACIPRHLPAIGLDNSSPSLLGASWMPGSSLALPQAYNPECGIKDKVANLGPSSNDRSLKPRLLASGLGKQQASADINQRNGGAVTHQRATGRNSLSLKEEQHQWITLKQCCCEIVTITLQIRSYCCLLFTGKEIWPRRGQVTCLGPHS
jgi:hypothetical protein